MHESDYVVKEAGAGMPRREFGHFFDRNPSLVYDEDTGEFVVRI